jgi:hypothetical protein
VNGLPHSVQIVDSNMVNAAGSGANRDDILISSDHGATAWTGDINSGFTLSAHVTLNDTSNSPRKEVGIRINAPVTGDALFILNSDSGEIVAFGGGAPFYNFRPAIEAQYIPGQTIFMQEQYVPGSPTTTGGTPGTLQYWAQLEPSGPLLTSGPLAWSNLEGGPGPSSFTIGFYDQAQSAGASDSITATFNGITAVVPEPASLGMLVLGGVTLVPRRRSRRA